MAYVNTTFLPKTSGLVFNPRFTARHEKGRIYKSGDGTGDGGGNGVNDVVPSPTVLGDPFVGEELRVVQPAPTIITRPNSGLTYHWICVDTGSVIGNGETYVVPPEMVGLSIACVTEASLRRLISEKSNEVGPIGWKAPNPVYTDTPDDITLIKDVKVDIRAYFTVEYEARKDSWQYLYEGEWKSMNRGTMTDYYPATEFWINKSFAPDYHSLSLRLENDGSFPSEFRHRLEDFNNAVKPSEREIIYAYFTITTN